LSQGEEKCLDLVCFDINFAPRNPNITNNLKIIVMEENKKKSNLSTGASAAAGSGMGAAAGIIGAEVLMAQTANAAEVETTVQPEPVVVHPEPTPVKPEPEPIPEPTPVPVEPDPIPVPEPAPIVEPTVEVLDYETLHGEDGSSIDLAVVSVNGQEMGLYDVDRDGKADLVAVDENGDGQITPNEVHDIQDADIAMQPLQNEYIAQNTIEPEPDYINDGNVDSYMA